MQHGMTHDDSTKSVNLTFRVYPAQRDQISRAAEKAGQSVSHYCLDVLLHRAAADLGEEVIDVLPERGRHNPVLQRMARELDAARRLGLSAEQLAEIEARYRAKAEIIAGLRKPRRVRPGREPTPPAPIRGRKPSKK